MNTNSFLGSKTRESELIEGLSQKLQPALEKKAEKQEEAPENGFTSVLNTLVRCANRLEEIGHPAAEKVDDVLAFIEKEVFTKEADAE